MTLVNKIGEQIKAEIGVLEKEIQKLEASLTAASEDLQALKAGYKALTREEPGSQPN